MATSTRTLLSRIGSWFSREPVVAVAAFGKCSAANGHQDVSGHATRGMLETARALYYDGALPNCRAWEEELRDTDRVLARTVLRWTEERVFLCRLASVGEGGTVTRAFAPLVACVEIEAGLALPLMSTAFRALSSVESELGSASPQRWSAILKPIEDMLAGEAERARALGVSKTCPQGVDELSAIIAELGPGATTWVASLAEELNLPFHASREAQRKSVALAGARSADVPRLRVRSGLSAVASGDGVESDVRIWAGVVAAGGVVGGEFWILADDDMNALHLVSGAARDRELRLLWSSRQAAEANPAPLGRAATLRALGRVEAWCASRGLTLGASGGGAAPSGLGGETALR